MRLVTRHNARYTRLVSHRLCGGVKLANRAMFQFQPLDRGLLWNRLLLQLSQVAELTGLDRRRLGYWVTKGYLVPATRNPDRFDGRAVEKALLLRQAISAGVPLRQALRLYDEFACCDTPAPLPPRQLKPTSLAYLHEQLSIAKRSLEHALDVLDNAPSIQRDEEKSETIALA